MDASYPRKYYFVSYDELDTIPIKAGNVVATYDTDGFYYDLPTASGELVRRHASSIRFVASLPVVDLEHPGEPTTIFVVKALDGEGNPVEIPDGEGGTVNLYNGYCWDANAGYYEIFNNFHDVQVFTEKVTALQDKAYLVASTSADDEHGTLIKLSDDIYITPSKKIHANLEGKADTAGSANTATSAGLSDYAKYSYNPVTQQPGEATTNYILGVSSSTDPTDNCTVITFTKGDGSSLPTIKTNNTEYQVYTSNVAGLVPGTNTTTPSDNTGLLLSGTGWIQASNFTIPLAQKAIADRNNLTIDDNYVVNASFNDTTNELLLILGNGNTRNPIPLPAYTVVSTTAPGLAPQLSTVDPLLKFLRGDANWATIPVYGAGGTLVNGLVPASGASADKVLKGDGTWVGPFSTSSNGLVPKPSNAETGYYLRGDGTWTAAVDTLNTAGSGTYSGAATSLYLVAAATQDSAGVQTYSDSSVYIQNHKIFSNGGEVVNLADSQTLSNKSFLVNGVSYPVGNACGSTTSASIEPGDVEDTVTAEGDGTTTTFDLNYVATNIISVTVNDVDIPDTDYSLNASDDAIIFNTAPGAGESVEIVYMHANTAYNPNALPTNDAVVDYTSTYVSGQLSGIYADLDSMLDSKYIAAPYDTSTSYVVGSFCTSDAVDEMKLYRCTSATTGDFDETKWTATTVIDAIKYLIQNT